jgi:DHA1 family tetracycline resistance protein-like MFS transporter
MKKYALYTVFLTVFLDILGFGLIIPLLPFYAQKFGANEFIIGTLLASNAVAQFIFNPIWGRISDKFGRRPVMLVTVLGSGIAYLLFGLANSLLLLFLSRIIAGISGASIGVAQSCITDMTTKEDRAKTLGKLGAVFALGFVFGPALSGFLVNPKIYLATADFAKYGLDLRFLLPYMYGIPGYVAAALSLINFFMVLFFLPESRKKTDSIEKKPFDWVEFNKVIKHPEMIILFFILFITMFSTSILFSTFSLFLQQKYGYGAAESGYMFTYFGICSVIIQGGLVGKLLKIFSETKLLGYGAACLTLGLGLLPFMPNIVSLCLVSFIIFLGNGVLNPCITSLVSQRANENQTGVTLGVSQSLGSLARIIGPLWGGYIFYIGGYYYPFISASILSLVVVVLAIKLLSKQEVQVEKPEVVTS